MSRRVWQQPTRNSPTDYSGQAAPAADTNCEDGQTFTGFGKSPVIKGPVSITQYAVLHREFDQIGGVVDLKLIKGAPFVSADRFCI